jgi:hypothetical protein
MIRYARLTVCCCLYALLVLAARPALARDLLLLGGAEGGGWHRSYNYYGFAAVVAPLFSEKLGDGFVQKYWLDVVGYDYPAGERTVDAAAVALEGALGVQTGSEHGWLGLYAGGRFADTWLSPDDPGSRVRGRHLRPKLQVEGERRLAADWKVNAIGSYIVGSDSYWARGRGLFRLYDAVFSGPELVVQGDPEYRAWQYGWVLTGFAPVRNSSLGVKAGVRKTEHADAGGYLGVEFSQLF